MVVECGGCGYGDMGCGSRCCGSEGCDQQRKRLRERGVNGYFSCGCK